MVLVFLKLTCFVFPSGQKSCNCEKAVCEQQNTLVCLIQNFCARVCLSLTAKTLVEFYISQSEKTETVSHFLTKAARFGNTYLYILVLY